MGSRQGEPFGFKESRLVLMSAAGAQDVAMRVVHSVDEPPVELIAVGEGTVFRTAPGNNWHHIACWGTPASSRSSPIWSRRSAAASSSFTPATGRSTSRCGRWPIPRSVERDGVGEPEQHLTALLICRVTHHHVLACGRDVAQTSLDDIPDEQRPRAGIAEHVAAHSTVGDDCNPRDRDRASRPTEEGGDERDTA